MDVRNTWLSAGLWVGFSAMAMAAAEPVTPDAPPVVPTDTRCVISAGAPVIDYGAHSRWQLQPATKNQMLTMGKRTLMLSVVCPYSQNMRLMLRGERASNGDLLYGSRGSLNLELMEAQVDGRATQITLTTPAGLLEGGAQDSLRLQPGMSFTATQNGQPIQGKSFTARIEIEPILPESAARVSMNETSTTDLTLEIMD